MAMITEARAGGRHAFVLSRDGDDGLKATFVPELAMLMSSLVHRGGELLDPRDGIEAYAERAATMAVPLLFPWANRIEGFGYRAEGLEVKIDRDSALVHTDGNGLPIHGAAPASLPFQVVRAAVDDGVPTLVAALETTSVRPIFPYPYRLEITARLSERALSIEATLQAKSSQAVPVAFGWHPYLTLPGAPREGWQLTIPARERVELDDRMIPTGRTTPAGDLDGALADRTFDDAFTGVDPGAAFEVAGGGRRIRVLFEEGVPFAQIYSPEGAAFICFEPMTAPVNALASGWSLRVAREGEPYRAAFRIEVHED